MATALTADAMLAALKKWGIAPKFYRDDWRTHNRNAAQGFGPINGFVVHNFGSDTSDPNSLAYLYRGDNARGMPGPLSQFAITDDGTVWIIGWGSANHTGYMEQGLHALVLKDAAPLDRDYRPTTTDSAGIGRVNPHYLGVEMTYGKAPTAAQRKSVTLLAAALMDALGAGYTGGSVVGHRECTKVRSDPIGVPMWQLRRDVNALLKSGPTEMSATPPKPAPTIEEIDMKFTDVIPGTNPPLTVGQALVRGAYAYGQVISSGSVAKALAAQGGQLNKQADALGALAADVDNLPETVKAVLQDAAVKVDVSVNYPEPPAPPAP